MNIKDSIEYQQDQQAMEGMMTLESIKACQSRSLIESLGNEEYVLSNIDGIIDEVVDRSYSDLINQRPYFQPMVGPTSLVFYNTQKLVVTARIDTLPMAFPKDVKPSQQWIDELVNRLRVIALGNMVQNRIFSIYVPFNLRVNTALMIEVKSRYGVLNLSDIK